MATKPLRMCVLDCGRKADCKVRSPSTGESRLLCRTCYDELSAASTNLAPGQTPFFGIFDIQPAAGSPKSSASSSLSSSSGGGLFSRIRTLTKSSSSSSSSTTASNVHNDAEARRHDPRLGSNLVASHYFPHMSVQEARTWVVRQLQQSATTSATAAFAVHGLGEGESVMLVTFVYSGERVGESGAVSTVRVISAPNEMLVVEGGGAGEHESIHTYLVSIGVIADAALAGPWVPPIAALRREPPLVPLLALYTQPSKQAANVLRAQRNIKCLLTARPTERQTLAIVVRNGTEITKSLIVREGDRYYFRPGDGVYAESIVDLLRIAKCIDERDFPPTRRMTPPTVAVAAAAPLRRPLPAPAPVSASPARAPTLSSSGQRTLAAPAAPTGGGASSGKLYASVSEAMRHGSGEAQAAAGGDVLLCTVRLAKLAELDERHRDLDGVCLMTMPWYHGAMPSDAASALLDGAPVGTFLVRTSVQRSAHAWALSVVQARGNGQPPEVAHVRVHNDDGRQVRVDGFPSTFPTARVMVAQIPALMHAMPRRTDSACRAETPLRVTRPAIGKGATGVVFRARVELPELADGGVVVALKQLRSELEGDADEQASMAREVDTMLLIPPHPNIVALLGIVMQAPIGIVTEFLANGSLDALLYKQRRRFTPPEQRRLASEIACGVAFLHANNIVHRDLATRNILLSESMTAKVSDFGMSRMLGDAKYNYSQIDSGPIRWMAPEQLRRKQGVTHSIYSPATDAFSFAMTLVELSTNQLPWPHLTNVEAAIAVCQAERPELDTALVEPTVLRVVQACWAHEPSERLTVDKAHAVLVGKAPTNDDDDDDDLLDDLPTPLDDAGFRPTLASTPPRAAFVPPAPAAQRLAARRSNSPVLPTRQLPTPPTPTRAAVAPRPAFDEDEPPPPPADEEPPPSPPEEN